MQVGRRMMSGMAGGVAVVALIGLSGCATTGTQGGAAGTQASLPAAGKVVFKNGIRLTEVDRNAFPLGKFKGFPVIAQRSDYTTLSTMSKDYARASWSAATQKDWESFIVNRHLGMRLVEYRLNSKLATTAFVDSLSSRGDGSGVLPAGATVFLPGFTRWGSSTSAASTTVSSIEAITSDLANHDDVVFIPDWKAAPKVADLGGVLSVLKTASDVMAGGVAVGGAKQADAKRKANNLLAQLPVGKTFTAHDASGNSFIVERTDDGFIVGNSGARPVTVPLGELGYVPDMPVPNADRQAAAPLVLAMQAARQTLFWQAMQGNYAYPMSATRAPNKTLILNTKVNGFLDADGNLTTNPVAIAAGAAAYDSKAGYRTAVEMADFSSHRDAQFQAACFAMSGHQVYDTDYTGEYAEILQHQCLDAAKGILRQKDVYVRDGKTMQTFASLLKDKQLAETLKSADDKKDLAESVVEFVPGIGNVDAGAKCLTGTSLTSWLSTNAVKYANSAMPLVLLPSELKNRVWSASSAEQSRAFVSDLLIPAEDVTTLSKSLTCASALPVLGTVIGKAAKAGSLVNGYRKWMNTEHAAAVVKSLDWFDTNPFSTAAPIALNQADGLTSNGLAVVKRFYDSMQLMSSGKGLVEAAHAVIE